MQERIEVAARGERRDRSSPSRAVFFRQAVGRPAATRIQPHAQVTDDKSPMGGV
jgi:hypothetical protein